MNAARRLLARLAKTLFALSLGAQPVAIAEASYLGHAKGRVIHQRCRETLLTPSGYVPAYRDDSGALVAGQRWITADDGVTQICDARDYETLFDGESLNVKPTVSIDFIFSQSYNSTSAAQTDGLAWIALSNDSLTETTSSTTLSNEIAANGLTRAKGTYAHTTAASTATVTKTFTATGAQSAQKAALFSASSSGTMGHALSYTARSLVSTDTLAITFTITLT